MCVCVFPVLNGVLYPNCLPVKFHPSTSLINIELAAWCGLGPLNCVKCFKMSVLVLEGLESSKGGVQFFQDVGPEAEARGWGMLKTGLVCWLDANYVWCKVDFFDEFLRCVWWVFFQHSASLFKALWFAVPLHDSECNSWSEHIKLGFSCNKHKNLPTKMTDGVTYTHCRSQIASSAKRRHKAT